MIQERIAFTAQDKQTIQWAKMQEYWTQQLAQLRSQNDHDMPEVATAKLRGRIQQIKAFLSMDEEMPKID